MFNIFKITKKKICCYDSFFAKLRNKKRVIIIKIIEKSLIYHLHFTNSSVPS